MTNETTASQPKSIGDDAKDAQRDLMHITAFLGEKQAPQTLINRIKSVMEFVSRAPAAKASATIQAAPELAENFRRSLILNLERGRGGASEDDWRDAETTGAYKFFDQIAEVVRAAATIQEPVMVAEPVEPRFFMDHGMWHDRETGQHMYTEDELYEKYRDGLADGKTLAECATPTVAEAVDVDKMIASGPMGIPVAATVKAVPSEALDVPDAGSTDGWEHTVNDWMVEYNIEIRHGAYRQLIAIGNEFADNWTAQNFAAPLADKTGGGK